MCWCDEYNFTINRGDEFMVQKKGDGPWFSITPPDLIKIINVCIVLGYLKEHNKFTTSIDEFVSVRWQE